MGEALFDQSLLSARIRGSGDPLIEPLISCPSRRNKPKPFYPEDRDFVTHLIFASGCVELAEATLELKVKV